MEVVEDVLFVPEHPGPVPVLALLAAAAQASHRVHAAQFDPGEDCRRIPRVHAEPEPPVAVQDGRPGRGRRSVCPPRGATVRGVTVGGVTVPGVGVQGRNHDHPDLGAVRGLVGHLPCPHRWHPDLAGRAAPHSRPAASRVVPVHRDWGGVVGIAKPCLVAALRALTDPAHRTQAGQ